MNMYIPIVCSRPEGHKKVIVNKAVDDEITVIFTTLCPSYWIILDNEKMG